MKTLLCLAASALLIALSPSARAHVPPVFEDGDRVLWLGDSVTANGRHIAYIDAYMRARWPDKNIHFINAGLSSETASGLSEPHHPWPRPCVAERIDRLVEKVKFGWAIVCYGVNDAIYHPFDAENFAAYTSGITRTVEKLHEAGAKVILLSPMPFDAGSVNPKKLLPAGGGDYGFRTPFADYNGVMLKYADWIETFTGPATHRFNVTRPLTDAIAARREAEPGFKSGDGVHPNAEGYALIAKVLLGYFGIPDGELRTGIDVHQLGTPSLDARQAAIVALAEQKNALLSVSYREHIGHKRPGAPKDPLPLDQALEKAAAIDQEIRTLALKPN